FRRGDASSEMDDTAMVDAAARTAGERTRTRITPEVRFASPSDDACLLVSDLVCDAVSRMLVDPADRAAYDRLETKIRLVHDSGRDIFYSRDHPFRGRDG